MVECIEWKIFKLNFENWNRREWSGVERAEGTRKNSKMSVLMERSSFILLLFVPFSFKRGKNVEIHWNFS